MKPNRIELNIINLDIDVFNDILKKFFLRERSSIYPICVDVDKASYWDENYSETYYYGEDTETFRFSMAPIDFSFDDWRVLAKIHQFKLSSQLGVIIIGEEEQAEEWENVISITEKIIIKIQQFEGEIVFADPVQLMPAKLFLNKEDSKGTNIQNRKNDQKVNRNRPSENLLEEWNKLSKTTKDMYRKVLNQINDLEDQYYELSKSKGVENPKPTTNEQIEMIHNATGEVISERTLRRIKRYKNIEILENTENL